MAITLGSNVSSLRAQGRLNQAVTQLSGSLERLASGSRINHASDDAVGLSIASSLESQGRIFRQGARNLNDGISLLNIADGVVNELTQVVHRLTELAEQAANGVYSLRQRTALDSEAQALRSEFARVVASTRYNGMGILDGSLSGISLQGGGNDRAISMNLNAVCSYNVGDGTFATPVSYTAAGTADFISLGDVNNDGSLDILSTDDFQARSILINWGDGTFGTAVTVPSTNSGPQAILADINKDGYADVVSGGSAGQASIYVHLSSSSGTFSQSASLAHVGGQGVVAVGDFNNDTYLDIAASSNNGGELYIYLGVGGGTFQAGVSTAQAISGNIACYDLNGDSFDDIVANNGGSNVQVFLSRGDGAFTGPLTTNGSANGGLALGDINGDSVVDLVTGYVTTDSYHVRLGVGDGTFGTTVSTTLSYNLAGLALGDYNGDGRLDLALADSDNDKVYIRLGIGDGTFSAGVSYAMGGDMASLRSGDMNNDGVLDLIGVEGNRVSIALGNYRAIAGIRSFSLLSTTNALSALTQFNAVRDSIASWRGAVGAIQQRISTDIRVLGITQEGYAAARSRIMDVDVASETAKLASAQILTKIGDAVLAQANAIPKIALKLLAR